MNHVDRYNKITKTATTVANSWTNREIVMFHYFNPNGLTAAKTATDKKIDALVDLGLAKSGAILTRGSLNSYYTNRLGKMFDKKAVKSIELQVVLKGLRGDIENANEFIAEKTK